MKYMKKSFSSMEPYFSAKITDGVILNANESPYLPPQPVLDEINARLANLDFNRYPDMQETALCEAIAKYHNVLPENVTVGVGSDELLDVVFRSVLEPNDKVLSFSPSFSMYSVFADLVNAKFIGVNPVDGIFNIDDVILKIKEENPKLVLICSPNNPTGQFFTKEDIVKVITSTNALIGLDLAYIDFADVDYSNIALEYDNVIVFRTFSKALSLPSIRVGYAISKKDNIDMILAVKAPYSVSTISQIIAEIAIKNKALYKNQIEEIKKDRDLMLNALTSLGLKPYPSKANFIYLKLNKEIYDDLVYNKVYIRKLKNDYYRISIGNKEENKALMEVLKKYGKN